jgi:predicted RNA-binding protein with PIN domain
MRYVVDAFNLAHKDRDLDRLLDQGDLRAVREAMVRKLGRFAYGQGIAGIVLVFDGSEKGAHLPQRQEIPGGKLVLVFAYPGSADRAIIELVEADRLPGQVTVVTSDKAIIRSVGRLGAHCLTSEAFLRRVRGAERRAHDPWRGEHPGKYGTHSLSPREIEEWLRYFGFDDGEGDEDAPRAGEAGGAPRRKK